MIWALVILTVIFAATALVLVLWPRLNGRPAPVRRIPLVQPHTGRHVATERIHAGGRYLGTLPRRDAPPLTEQTIIVQRPGRPWDTYPRPVLRQYDEHLCAAPGEHGKTGPYYCTLPAHHSPLNDDAETLRLGGWGTMPGERVIAAEGERLASVMLP